MLGKQSKAASPWCKIDLTEEDVQHTISLNLGFRGSGSGALGSLGNSGIRWLAMWVLHVLGLEERCRLRVQRLGKLGTLFPFFVQGSLIKYPTPKQLKLPSNQTCRRGAEAVWCEQDCLQLIWRFGV